MVADHRRKLESVGFRHVNVDEDDGDILLQKVLERFARAVCRDQVLPQIAQDRLVRHQLCRLIVDEKYVYFFLHDDVAT